MKKLNLLLLFMLPIMAFSQYSWLDYLFEDYSGKEGYTSVYVTKHMFELFAEVSTDEELKDFNDITSKLDAIKILATSDGANEKQIEDFKENVLDELQLKREYKDLMIIREGKQNIVFKVREKFGKILELVMLSTDENEAVLIYLSGEINLNKISKLSKSIKINGLQHLDKISK